MIRLLIVYDVEGWAYHARACSLQRHAPPDFSVEIAPWTSAPRNASADIVLNLEYKGLRRFGNVPHVVSFNADSKRRAEMWEKCRQNCDWLLCNNKDVWEARGRQQRTCCISNGVELGIFNVQNPIEGRSEVAFLAGSSNPAKGKGFEIARAAESRLAELGFRLRVLPVESSERRPHDLHGMAREYNDCGYVLCLSESEGSPNTSLEGMACGCALVSTRVGNVLEFGRGGENCVLIERSVDGLVEGLLRARMNRAAIASEGAELMRREWCYSVRSHWYFQLFRRLVQGGEIRPFSYDETEWCEI